MKRHWNRDPAPSTESFVEAAHFERTKKGLQMVAEVIAYPEGHINVAVSYGQSSTRAPGYQTPCCSATSPRVAPAGSSEYLLCTGT
jgi:hypothetical protein